MIDMIIIIIKIVKVNFKVIQLKILKKKNMNLKEKLKIIKMIIIMKE